jgi:DNA-binding beta-propeller fold protein YncE
MNIRTTALLATALVAVSPAAAAAQSQYAVTGKIAGPDGGWDYASVDKDTRRLYVAHGNAITSVDLRTGKVTPALAPAARPHEVLPIPGTGMVLETDGDTGTARLIDGATGAEKAKIAVGMKPDAAIWDARRKQAIVMNAKSGTIMTIDPVAAKVTGTVTLAEGLEFAAIDKAGRLFVNNEDRNQIAVVDLDKMAALGWIDLPGCEGPTGIAYAETADRIVSACGNGVAAVVDPSSRKLVATIPIGKRPDAVIADPARKRLLVPSGVGTLAVLAEAPGTVTLVQTVTTEASARTGAVDPTDGKVYLPAAQMAAPAQPGARPQVVPGSFHLIVVSPQ